MSGVDKAVIGRELEEKGWTEDPDDENRYIPPESLFANKPKSFHVYHAEQLQYILAEIPSE